MATTALHRLTLDPMETVLKGFLIFIFIIQLFYRTTIMTEFGKLQCEPCMHENVTKSAIKWCTDCEEGFCEECCRCHKAQKMSRNHHLISIEDNKETKKFNVNLDCPEHSKQFDFYCPTHDSVICVVCIQSKHGGCEDLRKVNEAAKDAKTSTAFTDLEQTIDGLLENIERGVRHLQQNQTNLKEQQDVTKKSIATKRAEINKHLDLLEETLLEELNSKSEKTMKEMSLMTTKLETQRKNISDLKDTAQHMKQFSSNLQMFVGIRSILKTVVSEINGIKLMVNSIPQLSIGIYINPKFDIFTEAFDSLGEIQITSKEAVVPYVERLLLQAQYQRPAEQLDNVQLKLKTNIKMAERDSEVTSCLILPNKSIMIANRNKTLTILNEDGSHDRDIRVPNDPYDVTIIDDKRVAISYGADKTRISIVNIKAHNANQTLKKLCKFGISGITYNDGKLYAVTDGEGIKVTDLYGNIIQKIRICDDGSNTHKVTIHKDKIYYSVNNGSVYCVDIEGTEIWKCQDDRLKSLLLSPAIAVDNYGITFAAGYFTNLLLAISPDGKQQKVLLTSSDGLQKPNAVYYDKDSKRLLVCNHFKGNAALYDVIY